MINYRPSASHSVKSTFAVIVQLIHQIIGRIFSHFYYRKLRRYKGKKKIIWALTPPPGLRNLGDHAQAVAIRGIFRDFFGDYAVVELDKNEVYLSLWAIKKILGREDIIFLQSGGNLNSRSPWSENGRRLIIRHFKSNRIISLPQTIYFEETGPGREELSISRRIYNQHPNLTIVARDSTSLRLAREYFPSSQTTACPDVVLYLPKPPKERERRGILLCIRNDRESQIGPGGLSRIREIMEEIGKEYEIFDTVVDHDVEISEQEQETYRALRLFMRHEAVVTDRLHGLIFSVVTQTPCIVLNTADHKIKKGIEWFEGLDFIYHADAPDSIKKLIREACEKKKTPVGYPDWKSKYFNGLFKKIREETAL